MPDASCTASTDAPAHNACCTASNRSSVGTRVAATRASRSGAPGPSAGSTGNANADPRRSRERIAFCRASVKLRPMAMASPTDFMVVVRVRSAEGNFSNANRGILTTT